MVGGLGVSTNLHMLMRFQAVYAFWQYEVCDVFIEVSKPWFTAAAAPGSEAAAVQLAARETLWISLDAGLRCGL